MKKNKNRLWIILLICLAIGILIYDTYSHHFSHHANSKKENLTVEYENAGNLLLSNIREGSGTSLHIKVKNETTEAKEYQLKFSEVYNEVSFKESITYSFSRENKTIERAKFAREEQEKYLFCAEKVNAKMSDMIIDKTITPEVAVNELTDAYFAALEDYNSEKTSFDLTPPKPGYGYEKIDSTIDETTREQFNKMFKEAIPKEVMDRFEANKERIEMEMERDNGQRNENGKEDKGDDTPDNR